MRICLVLEGSYPYVRGGVSNWVEEMISSMPGHEFVLWTINDLEEKKGKFAFELSPNVAAVQESFLDTALGRKLFRKRQARYSDDEIEEIEKLVRCQSPDWRTILDTFSDPSKKPLVLFTSEELLNILKRFCEENYPFVGFADLYWTIRSMFLPLLFLLTQPIPEADIYHSVSTGYAGVLGALGALKNNRPLLLSEHGIYTREREEEILRADWVVPYFKELWISMFYMYSRFAYEQAWRVTSLFRRASLIQQDIGCPAEKCVSIKNGIEVETFSSIPAKNEDGWTDIAAIVRIAPIKDIKTMIYTFSRLKQEIKNVRLHILGGVDDEDYYQECLSLVDFLGVKDIYFAGNVDVPAYLEKIDFTLLTSISEGQPYAVLESMAAGRPLVSTDVGSIRELIDGEEDDTFGPAGLYAPPMHQSGLLNALMEMCMNKKMRLKMGANGKGRIEKYYTKEEMVKKYKNLYEKAVESWQVLVSN